MKLMNSSFSISSCHSYFFSLKLEFNGLAFICRFELTTVKHFSWGAFYRTPNERKGKISACIAAKYMRSEGIICFAKCLILLTLRVIEGQLWFNVGSFNPLCVAFSRDGYKSIITCRLGTKRSKKLLEVHGGQKDIK